MHFDALCLACIAHELRQRIQNGRVQSVLMTGERSVGLEIYAERQRHYLHLSLDSRRSVVYLAGQKLRRGTDQTPPLLLLLRKYVRDSRLVGIVQPQPTERSLSLTFDHPQHGESRLVVEPMGRLSNLFLLDGGGQIRGLLVAVPPGENARRTLLPNRPYSPPPEQQKRSPLASAEETAWPAESLAAAEEAPLWRWILDQVAGVSPTQAREIAYRVAGSATALVTDGIDGAALGRALTDLWRPVLNGQWQPGVIEEAGELIGFAPYPLHHRGVFVPLPTLSLALDRYYGGETAATSAQEGPDPYAALRGNVRGLIREARRRIDRQLAALAEDEPAPGEPASLRLQAEWLLALSSQIQPGQERLEIPLEPEPLHIRLDPRLSPVEQAERTFDRAAKLERAAQQIPVRRRQLLLDGAHLDQLSVDLGMAQNQPEIAAVQEELREAGYLRSRGPKPAGRAQPTTSQPIRFLSQEGFAVLVGRNARQNERVTFEMARGDDWWFHVRQGGGAHVVIRNGGQPVGPETLQAAAQLAAYYSDRRGEPNVAVAYTQRRHVSRAAGGHRGQVFYQNEETIVVPARRPEWDAD